METEKPKATPRDFFLWAGAMLAFYVSVFAFLNLIFDYINYIFPDPLITYSIDPYQSGIGNEMAALIVLFPLFLVLMRFIRRDISRDQSRGEVWVRRWALVFTIFIAGASIAIDLITLLSVFFNGEDVTTRFLLKIILVLLVASAGFLHFFADLRGYWKQFPERARTVGWAVGVLILVSIVAGFFIVGTPQQARLRRFDAQKVSDLQSIQYQVVTYWQAKQQLPTTLADVSDPISGFTVPTDPQTKQQYEYQPTGALSFQLCAQFNSLSDKRGVVSEMQTYPVAPTSVPASVASYSSDNWQHSAGRTCFDRTIDAQRYPPIKK